MLNINNKPLSEDEIREYLKKKSFNFSPSDKGKFVIMQKPRKRGLVTRLYLVNRNITKDFWWSHDVQYAMKFDSKDDAKQALSKLKYNNPEIIRIK